jgi:hypothetical protein
MQIVKVELLKEQALKLLQQLEELKILRLVPPQSDHPIASRKWAGSISKETARRMLQHSQQIRNEWDRI